jgi:hypothetical protein
MTVARGEVRLENLLRAKQTRRGSRRTPKTPRITRESHAIRRDSSQTGHFSRCPLVEFFISISQIKIEKCRYHRATVIERFISSLTKFLNGKAVFSCVATPPSEFITDNIIVHHPSTSVRTFIIGTGQMKTHRFVLVPNPIAEFRLFSHPSALNRQFLQCGTIKFLCLC